MDITSGHVFFAGLIFMAWRSFTQPIKDATEEARILREETKKLLGKDSVETTIVEEPVATSPLSEDEENVDDLDLINKRIVRGIINFFRVYDVDNDNDDDDKIYFARIDVNGQVIDKFRQKPSDYEKILLNS